MQRSDYIEALKREKQFVEGDKAQPDTVRDERLKDIDTELGRFADTPTRRAGQKAETA